jgi:hypothetical protein
MALEALLLDVAALFLNERIEQYRIFGTRPAPVLRELEAGEMAGCIIDMVEAGFGDVQIAPAPRARSMPE